MTTGAAMAATGTELCEELATEGVVDAVEVGEVDDGAGVIRGVDVLFCWYQANSVLRAQYSLKTSIASVTSGSGAVRVTGRLVA